MKFYLLGILFLCLNACGDTEKVFTPLAKDAVILAFGDSLTYGTGTNKNFSYPALLEKLTQHKVINKGVPGEISSAGLKRLPKLLDQYKPRLLILIHGGNDILKKIPIPMMNTGDGMMKSNRINIPFCEKELHNMVIIQKQLPELLLLII